MAKPFATPRRLAVAISHVLEKQADRKVERKGPAVATALDAAGRPTPALIGFAKSCGVELAKLEKRAGDKGEYFVYCSKQKARPSSYIWPRLSKPRSRNCRSPRSCAGATARRSSCARCTA